MTGLIIISAGATTSTDLSDCWAGAYGARSIWTRTWHERYVALKLIAPQFMRTEEFIRPLKRRRGARVRLRHPNVVDVTTSFPWQAKPVAMWSGYIDG